MLNEFTPPSLIQLGALFIMAHLHEKQSKLVNMVLNIHRNHMAYWGWGEGGGEGLWRWQGGERDIIYPLLHCHHQNDFCIKMGSDESHFNVSVGSDGQSHKTVSTNHNVFEERGEPKRYQTKVLLLTSPTPYCYDKPAHAK